MPSSKDWGIRIVQEGDTVMLPCELDLAANPEPSYHWGRMLDGMAATPIQEQAGRIYTTTDHQLQINMVMEEDDGLYECRVSNDLGQSLQVIRLQVGQPTTGQWVCSILVPRPHPSLAVPRPHPAFYHLQYCKQ